ncbi:FIG00638442: hypothetical protein [Escherichia coli IS25]|nr:FIG00638442: hypothetical protein [Escherichia coli IS25]
MVVVVPVLEPSPPPVAASATPTAELTVLTLVAEELPAETDVAADPAASPTCTGAAHAEVAASADMAKMPYRTFFHNNFPSLNEWRFTQKHFGRDRVYTTKACELRRGELAMAF